jgi:DNA repair exonuclease SbcCD ATPase subunit
LEKIQTQHEARASEIDTLRNRAGLSQQNWVKERDELIRREAFAREEYEQAKTAMQEWEVLAMEERSVKQNLGDRVTELEEQLSAVKEDYERVVSDRDSQKQLADGLQRALRDIQDGMSLAHSG